MPKAACFHPAGEMLGVARHALLAELLSMVGRGACAYLTELAVFFSGRAKLDNAIRCRLLDRLGRLIDDRLHWLDEFGLRVELEQTLGVQPHVLYDDANIVLIDGVFLLDKGVPQQTVA